MSREVVQWQRAKSMFLVSKCNNIAKDILEAHFGELMGLREETMILHHSTCGLFRSSVLSREHR